MCVSLEIIMFNKIIYKYKATFYILDVNHSYSSITWIFLLIPVKFTRFMFWKYLLIFLFCFSSRKCQKLPEWILPFIAKALAFLGTQGILLDYCTQPLAHRHHLLLRPICQLLHQRLVGLFKFFMDIFVIIW